MAKQVDLAGAQWNQPGDDAWQRAFHSSDNDHDSRGFQPGALVQQTMNASDAGVPNAIHGVTHCFRSQRRFFRDGNVACAGCHDCDRADTEIRFVATDAYESGCFVPFRVCNHIANLTECVFVSACDEDVG